MSTMITKRYDSSYIFTLIGESIEDIYIPRKQYIAQSKIPVN